MGVSELSIEGGVSGESQVSVNDSISIDFSVIKSFSRAGLSKESVIEAAERVLR